MVDNNNIQIGDYVIIHKVALLCSGFNATQQRLYHVGSIHKVVGILNYSLEYPYVLEGNSNLCWSSNEVRKVS